MTIQDELHLKSLQSKYESETQDLREKLAKKKAKLKAARAVSVPASPPENASAAPVA